MELVRVLPSAEDEVNVACFHPRVGGGLVYGTKVNSFLFVLVSAVKCMCCIAETVISVQRQYIALSTGA